MQTSADASKCLLLVLHLYAPHAASTFKATVRVAVNLIIPQVSCVTVPSSAQIVRERMAFMSLFLQFGAVSQTTEESSRVLQGAYAAVIVQNS